jgi:hypothetical protein
MDVVLIVIALATQLIGCVGNQELATQGEPLNTAQEVEAGVIFDGGVRLGDGFLER